MSGLKSFLSFSNKDKYVGTKTFTYYLPAPPKRKNGYQEKELDYLLEKIIAMGFTIIDINMSSHSNSDNAGLWVICLLGAPTLEILNKKIDLGADDLKVNNNTNMEIEYD